MCELQHTKIGFAISRKTDVAYLINSLERSRWTEPNGNRVFTNQGGERKRFIFESIGWPSTNITNRHAALNRSSFRESFNFTSRIVSDKSNCHPIELTGVLVQTDFEKRFLEITSPPIKRRG